MLGPEDNSSLALKVLNSLVENRVGAFPEAAQKRFLEIRSLIYRVAQEHHLGELEETLKWGQPSYLCKYGSTPRVDWQPRYAESIDLFFNCKTSLIETIKEVYAEVFDYRGNRVIALPLIKPLPHELETCVLMALNYHKLKKLPLLGA